TFSKENDEFERQKDHYIYMDDVKTVKVIPTPEGDFDFKMFIYWIQEHLED
ncbi:9175_t:CDS:1, partial [Paraglomus occultum]